MNEEPKAVVNWGTPAGKGGVQLYLIWSEEHGAWWRPFANGYTHFITEAGRYTKSQADDILVEANKVIHPETGFLADRKFNEIAIPDPMG